MSSMCWAVRAKISLTSIPLWPYFWNRNGDGRAVPVFRSVVRFPCGSIFPSYFFRSGLGSNVSTSYGHRDRPRRREQRSDGLFWDGAFLEQRSRCSASARRCTREWNSDPFGDTHGRWRSNDYGVRREFAERISQCHRRGRRISSGFVRGTSSVPSLVIGAPVMVAPLVSCTVSSSTMLPPVSSLI